MFNIRRPAAVATPVSTRERIDTAPMQSTIEAPAVNALAASIAGISVEQLVELRRTTAGEIERLQAAISTLPAAAAHAFEARDADGVRSAWESEAQLTQRLADRKSTRLNSSHT